MPDPLEYTIRPFETLQEFHDCMALQEEVWGRGFSERVPTAILMVSQRLGGIASGAWNREGELVGFVFGMTGVDEEGLVHWSDMLAVRSGLRDSGLGRRLKAYQREFMLQRGVRRMTWTFDPLQSRNAYLNLVKLGVVVREYVRDMYGQTDSPLHRGIGTDRMVALWKMDTARVERRLSAAGTPAPEALDAAARVLEARSGAAGPVPGEPRLDVDASVLAVPIPADIDDMVARSPQLAVRWRQATRGPFETYLDGRYEARELVRSGPVSYYLLERRRLAEDVGSGGAPGTEERGER